MGTGGGPAYTPQYTEVEQKVLAIIGTLMAEAEPDYGADTPCPILPVSSFIFRKLQLYTHTFNIHNIFRLAYHNVYVIAIVSAYCYCRMPAPSTVAASANQQQWKEPLRTCRRRWKQRWRRMRRQRQRQHWRQNPTMPTLPAHRAHLEGR